MVTTLKPIKAKKKPRVFAVGKPTTTKIEEKKPEPEREERRKRDRRERAPQETKVTTLPTIKAERAEPKKKGIFDVLKSINTIGGLLQPPEGTKMGTVPIGGPTTFARIKAGGAFVRVASNVKTIARTTTMLTKIGLPLAVASLAVAVIGTYPFAGFIKEEALQTLGLGINAAIRNEDIEGAELALGELDEVLRADVWEKIIAVVPFANVVKQLKDFYDAARIKAGIDRKIVEDLKIQQETGESDDEKWTRIREEQTEDEKENIDYYNEQRKQMVEWEREAAKQARNEDAVFWRKQREAQTKMEAADRKAIADFWTAYRKESIKLAQDNRPSNLNFGLL